MEEIGSGALGLALAFLGFCFAVMGIRGTYVTAYEALVHPATSSTAAANKNGSSPT